MHRVDRGRWSVVKMAISFAVAVVIFGIAPPLARATLITSAGTVASSIGNGFTAYTHTATQVDLSLESDAYTGNSSYNYQNSETGATYIEIYAAVPGCSGSFSVSTQHRAHDPVTNEYDFASSGADGSCY